MKIRKELALKAEPAQPSWVWAVLGWLKPILIAIIASIAGIITYVATPLKEYVNTWIWEEKAQVMLYTQNLGLSQGEVLHVDVFIEPESPAPISEGVLKIEYSNATLRPGAETISQLTTATPRITAAKKVNERTLEFIADAPGKAEIVATLRNKGGTFQQRMLMDIGEKKDQLFPTWTDFTGKWNIVLGTTLGIMNLYDKARTINGDYKLRDGSYGQVEGIRDGETFTVTFYRGSVPSKFFIRGKFDQSKSDKQILGTADLISINADANQPDATLRQMAFEAVAQTR